MTLGREKMSRRRVARRGLPLPAYFESFSRARTRADADADGRGEGWTRDATASARAARGCPVGCRDWSDGMIARARMDDATAMATRARTKSDRGDDGDDVSRVRRGRRRARAAFEFVIDVRVLLLRVSGDVKDAGERGTSRWIDKLFHGDVDPFARDEIF